MIKDPIRQAIDLLRGYIDHPDLYDAIAVLEAAIVQRAAEGWVMVPIEPTPEMISAGRSAPMCATAAHSIIEDYVALYKAMLEAAPSNQKR